MVEKFGDKDAKNGNFINQMEFPKRSIKDAKKIHFSKQMEFKQEVYWDMYAKIQAH